MEDGMEEFIFKYGEKMLKYGPDKPIRDKLLNGILGQKDGFSRKIFSHNLDIAIEEIKAHTGRDIKLEAK